MRNINKVLIIPYLLWMVLFIIVPVILLVYFSFTDLNGHFSLTNYEQILSMKYLKMMYIRFLCSISTIITLLISYPAAYFIRSSKNQNMWLLILIIPTWINLLLKTYAFIGLLSHEGLINRFLNFIHLPSANLLFTPGAFFISSKLYLYTIYDFTYI